MLHHSWSAINDAVVACSGNAHICTQVATFLISLGGFAYALALSDATAIFRKPLAELEATWKPWFFVLPTGAYLLACTLELLLGQCDWFEAARGWVLLAGFAGILAFQVVAVSKGVALLNAFALGCMVAWCAYAGIALGVSIPTAIAVFRQRRERIQQGIAHVMLAIPGVTLDSHGVQTRPGQHQGVGGASRQDSRQGKDIGGVHVIRSQSSIFLGSRAILSRNLPASSDI